MRARLFALSLWIAWLAGCATPPAAPEDWLVRLANAPPPSPGDNFPMPPSELEPLMRGAEFRIQSAEPIGSGVMGAVRIDAYYPAIDQTLTFKWKVAPEGGEGWNSTPRREIAAYAIQKWFLDPEDYVVPTTVAVCIPLDGYTVDPDVEPNLPDVRCVFGNQSIWLERVKAPDALLDRARFYRDAAYARHLANYNLLTYLIENRDTRASNFLVSEDETNRRVYSVDNGISFGEPIYNFFATHWNAIRVPALPRDSIERLRHVDREDLDGLRVVAEFRKDPRGVLRETSPSAPFDAEEGVRTRDGVLQLGLRPGEIDDVRRRLRDLISAIDRGEIPVF